MARSHAIAVFEPGGVRATKYLRASRAAGSLLLRFHDCDSTSQARRRFHAHDFCGVPRENPGLEFAPRGAPASSTPGPAAGCALRVSKEGRRPFLVPPPGRKELIMNSRSMLLGGGVLLGWLTISSMAAASLRAAASSNEVDGAVFLPPASTV